MNRERSSDPRMNLLGLRPAEALTQQAWKASDNQRQTREDRAVTETMRLSAKDLRGSHVRQLDTPCELATYASLEQWEARAEVLRIQIRASAGLLPALPKSALRARVFGRTERPGYTIEKVYFETLPGFRLCGNLYRPAGSRGRRPTILSPHGHWEYGRLQHSEAASIPGRCRDFARQGYVVFSYDMVGYNDTSQLPHERLGAEIEELWGVSLLGLQLLNSIRACDFLCSLPDVDLGRIGCTGASGGGTQTFLLAAIDERIRVSAPVCMISASFQGGCICENTAGLRLDTNNVEFGALAAPRPLLLVSATGDWTRDNPTVEYPWLRSIYRLYGAEDRVGNAHFDAGHNYNLDTRLAVYRWFGRWLLERNDNEIDELLSRQFPHDEFRPCSQLVFYGIKSPKALSAERVHRELLSSARARVASHWPRSRQGLRRYRGVFAPIYRAALAAEYPSEQQLVATKVTKEPRSNPHVERFALGRRGHGDRIPAMLIAPPPDATNGSAVLWLDDRGADRVLSTRARGIGAIPRRLAEAGFIVLAIDCFGAEQARRESTGSSAFSTTYNRTGAAHSVQDILTAAAYLKSRWAGDMVLVGQGEAGLWALLARALTPQFTSCVADANGFDLDSDREFRARLHIPLLRLAGDLRTAVALAAPAPLLVHNTQGRFETSWLTGLYESIGNADGAVITTERLSPSGLVNCIASIAGRPRNGEPSRRNDT